MKRDITVSDFANFKLLGQLSSSPDGSIVLVEEQSASLEEDAYRTQILRVDVLDGTVRPFCREGNRNHSAVWSQNGRQIVFVRETKNQSQLYLMPADGGEAVQLTHFEHGVSSPKWSPDGTRIYTLVQTFENEDVTVLDTNLTDARLEEHSKKQKEKAAASPKRFSRLYYKHDGQGLSSHQYNQLVEINVESGEFRQLTWGDRDVSQYQISRDGQSIYFIQGRQSEQEWWAADLHRIHLKTNERSLVSDQLIFEHIEFSPNGEVMAALAMNENFSLYQSAANLKLFTLLPDGQILSELTTDFPDDLTASTLTDLRASVSDHQIAWSPDALSLFVLSTREGRGEMVRFRIDTSVPSGEVIAGGARDVYAFAKSGDSLIIAYATETNPSELAVIDEFEGYLRPIRSPDEPMQEISGIIPISQRVLYSPNEAFVNELNLPKPEPFWYQSTDGWWLQGWLIRPANFALGHSYPVILEIHGGPQANYGYAMFHEMQWLASQGYAVVYTNPRGSKSYGQTFVNAVRHHYGEMDAADVLAGLDAALERFGFLDANRVAVTGGSYGGFMTNWLVGHTNRFFAAVSQRSISNWVSFYGCSDIGPLFVESQLSDEGIGRLNRLWEMSPLAFADAVSTPILLLHSEDDLRCPIEQAEQFYTWLRQLGKEAEFLRIPNASHGLSRNGKPTLRVHRLEAIHEYIARHLPHAE